MYSKLYFLLVSISVAACSSGQQLTVYLKDFGAVANDHISDQAAFKKAARFINEKKKNVKLVIGQGKYIVGPAFQYDKAGKLVKFDALDDVLNLTECSNITIEGKGKVNIVFTDNIPLGVISDKTNKVTGGIDVGSLFRIVRCIGINIINIQADGNNNRFRFYDNWGLGTNAYERDHEGLFLMNSQQVTVKNCSFNRFVRDGCLILGDTNQMPVFNIKFLNCNFLGNGRNGVSWTAGDSVTFYNCVFKNTSTGVITTNPGAGLDIEPERSALCSRGKFIKCEFSGNRGYAITSGYTTASDILFDSCRIIGTHNYAIYCGSHNMTFKNTFFAGSCLLFYDTDDPANGLKFFNCSFTDSIPNQKLYTLTYLAGITGRYTKFYDCSFTAYKVAIAFAEIPKKNNKSNEENCLFRDCSFSALFRKPSSYNQHALLVTNSIFSNCTFKTSGYADYKYVLNEAGRNNKQFNSRFSNVK